MDGKMIDGDKKIKNKKKKGKKIVFFLLKGFDLTHFIWRSMVRSFLIKIKRQTHIG